MSKDCGSGLRSQLLIDGYLIDGDRVFLMETDQEYNFFKRKCLHLRRSVSSQEEFLPTAHTASVRTPVFVEMLPHDSLIVPIPTPNNVSEPTPVVQP